MKILICSLSAILFFISGIAQKKFTPGYITKNNQDTVHGYLQEEIKKDLVDQVAFKNDLSASTISHFKADEISGFGIKRLNFIPRNRDVHHTVIDQRRCLVRTARCHAAGPYQP